MMKVNARNIGLAAAFAAVAIVVVLYMAGSDLSKKGQARRLALEHLTDPDSAKFRSLTVSSDGTIVCGEVNSKNRMGGYEGYRPFLVVDGQFFRLEPAPSDLAINLLSWRNGMAKCLGTQS